VLLLLLLLLMGVVSHCSIDGKLRQQCVSNGGLYRASTDCKQALACPRVGATDGVACCMPKRGCVTSSDAQTCTRGGGVALPAGSSCQLDGARLCTNGACCATTQTVVNLGSTSITSQPTLTCSATDRATCIREQFGHWTPGRQCNSGFQCIPDEVRLRVYGQVDSWSRQPSVVYNRDNAEARRPIGVGDVYLL
jgi:hypothetical protein